MLHDAFTYEQLHLGDLLVNLFHELNYEVDKFVLEHLLGMKVGDKKGDVVALHDVSAEQAEPSVGPRLS
jgi:hypothetical protein